MAFQQTIITGYIFIVGLVIGSFLNVCIYRIPLGISIAKGRSFCPQCKHALAVHDLIPFLSFMYLKGKCRYCKSKISWRYPMIELLTGLLFVFVYWQFGFTWSTLSYLTITAILLIVAMIDLDTMEIFDRMHMLLLIAGTPLLLTSNQGIWFHVLGGIIISLPLLFLMLATKGGIGGGDIKLMAVCGLILGPYKIVVAMIIASLSGALVAVILLLMKKASRKDMIPFGPFLAIGIYLAMLYSTQLIIWYFGMM